MKQKLIAFSIFAGTLFFLSCKKNNEATSSNGFAGSYRGTVSDTINGNYWATLNDYAIVINSTNTPGQVTLTNNLIITNTGTISGNNFTIPQTTATQTSSMKVVEWALGSFGGANNNTWTVTFYQDQINPNTGAYIARMKRACVLVKQ
jgi:hypothetical protein